MPQAERRFDGLLAWQVEVLKALDASPFISQVGNAWIRRYGIRRIPIVPDMITIDPVDVLEEDDFLLIGGGTYLHGTGPSISVPGYPGTWPGSVWANEQIAERVATEICNALIRAITWGHFDTEEL